MSESPLGLSDDAESWIQEEVQQLSANGRVDGLEQLVGDLVFKQGRERKTGRHCRRPEHDESGGRSGRDVDGASPSYAAAAVGSPRGSEACYAAANLFFRGK